MALSTAAAARRLAELRRLMAQCQPPLAAYIVPSSDAHASEYVAEHDKRRAFLCGFTGSAGTAVVTGTEALLWTDGRYFLAAQQQLAPGLWRLMKDRLRGTPSVEDWLAGALPRGARVGLDPRLFSVAGVRRLQARLAQAGAALDTSAARGNLVDAVWGSEAGRFEGGAPTAPQPPPPSAPAFVHPVRFAGASLEEKLARVRAALRIEGCAALVVAALDEVAWLLNLRGADVQCCPVVAAYAFVTLDGAVLCVDARKLGAETRAHLAAGGGRGASPEGAYPCCVKHKRLGQSRCPS